MWQYSIFLLKAGFHMIADDRRWQKHSSAILWSWSQANSLMYLVSSWIFFEAKTGVSFGFEPDVVVALGLREEINCSKISPPISAMLFALIFPRTQRACTFDISASNEMYGYSRLCDRLRSSAIIGWLYRGNGGITERRNGMAEHTEYSKIRNSRNILKHGIHGIF